MRVRQNGKLLRMDSRFLSFVLRHRPERSGIVLDRQGWVSVAELLGACARHGRHFSREELEAAVAANDKKRFVFSADGLRIRASQGHTVEVDLGYDPLDPPELLYHGTVARHLKSIRRNGLQKGRRHHVHLSADRETACGVGSRYGIPVVLAVRAGEMARAGMKFYRSANGVWMTDSVPSAFIDFPL